MLFVLTCSAIYELNCPCYFFFFCIGLLKKLSPQVKCIPTTYRNIKYGVPGRIYYITSF